MLASVNCLSYLKALAQSGSVMAPTAPVAILAPIFASAGKRMLGLVLVSDNINQSSRRSASTGSLTLKIVKPWQLRALHTKMKIKFLLRGKMENALSSAAGRLRR
jgi:hypothetical protein